MLCPNCKTENLITSERQNIQIDHCPRCRGVWLDRGELEKLVELSSSQEGQSDRYNGREFGEDEEAPRKRGGGETKSDDDDDDDDDRSSERGGTYRSRDRDDDNRGDTRRDTYTNRDRDDDQRGGRGGSIWREIFDNLSEKLPNLADKLPRP
jgi:uncharacterized protein